MLIIHKPSLGSCKAPHTFLGSIGSAILSLLDRNKQTNRQTSKVYILKSDLRHHRKNEPVVNSINNIQVLPGVG